MAIAAAKIRLQALAHQCSIAILSFAHAAARRYQSRGRMVWNCAGASAASVPARNGDGHLPGRSVPGQAAVRSTFAPATHARGIVRLSLFVFRWCDLIASTRSCISSRWTLPPLSNSDCEVARLAFHERPRHSARHDFLLVECFQRHASVRRRIRSRDCEPRAADGRLSDWRRSRCAADETAKISMIWFKAYGIAALGVQGPNSREIYKPFLASSRFRGLLPEAMRDGDDAIALVPGVSSLAHVVPAATIVRSTPINGNDVTEATRYVAALDDPGAPPANLRWTSRHSVEIEANLRPGDVISFQEAYHPGWHATLNGMPRRISRDGLGQMIVNTDFAGHAKSNSPTTADSK